jgi:hypothetical protein
MKVCNFQFPAPSLEFPFSHSFLTLHLSSSRPHLLFILDFFIFFASDIQSSLILYSTTSPSRQFTMARKKPVYSPKKPLYCHSPSNYVANKFTTRWALSSTARFSTSYKAKVEELDSAWKEVADLKGVDRPNPYASSTASPGEFLTIEDTDKFAATLANPTMASTEALYVSALNSGHALETLQKEYAAINTLKLRTIGDDTLHDIYHEKKINPRTKPGYLRKLNPQHMEDPDRYEGQKEADLYNYKYKEDTQDGFQDPWTQGGFVPTADEVAAVRAKHGDDIGNVDGFPTILNRNGVETAPRRAIPPPEPKKEKKKVFDDVVVPSGPRATRGKKRRYDFESEESQTPLESESDALATNDMTPGKMTTRFRGLKKPPTRSASVTPFPLSQTASPAPKRARVQRAPVYKAATTATTDASGHLAPVAAGGKKAVEKNPNRSRGMRELWKRRKESGWVRKPKGTAKVDTKALAAAEKKAEEIRRNSQVAVTAPIITETGVVVPAIIEAGPASQEQA